MRGQKDEILPLISIVTVSRNAEEHIAKTIESVLEQTYKNIEYIIIDGNSTDSTYNIIMQYEKKFLNKGIRYFYVTEQDTGIYDAMNKALKYCRGDWVLYLNVKDRIYSKKTLERIYSENDFSGFHCIYGNTMNVIGDKTYKKESFAMDVIYYKAPFIHQALFIRTEIMKRYLFDTDYFIAADYDLFVRMFVDELSFIKIEEVIAYFDLGGVSQNNLKLVQNEWKKIQKSHGLYKHHRIRRAIRNLFILPLKQNYIVYMIYIKVMKFLGDKSENKVEI